MNLRSPKMGPILHGIATFLLTEGYPITKYVYQAVLDRQASPNVAFNWDFFFLGLAATGMAVFISARRNENAVSLSLGEIGWIKGVMTAGPDLERPAVVVAAREIVSNDEPVIVLRGREMPSTGYDRRTRIVDTLVDIPGRAEDSDPSL